MTESRALPERVDPRRLAATGGRLEGTISLSGMRRLADYLLAEEGPVAAEAQLVLDFAEDAQRRVTMDGRLSAHLRLQCQRCMQPLDWPLETVLCLTAVADEDAAVQVPKQRDPVVIGEAGLITAELVEDELLLALPPVARCEDPDCPRIPAQISSGGNTRKPFAVLERLKQDQQE